VTTEDVIARQDALTHVDVHVPMALEPAVKPKRRGRLTEEEKARREAARLAAREERAREREAKKAETARLRELARARTKQDKIDAAAEGYIPLPAVVFRDGTVKPVSYEDAVAVIEHCLQDLCLDTETSGYWIGHRYYELRTVQLGGEDMAVVLNAADELSMEIVRWAVAAAARIWAHSVTADAVPLVVAGLVSWKVIWAKLYDSVIRAKLTDPRLCGSEADKLKELARDLLGTYAVSPGAEEKKNELFKAMGCLMKTDNTTPPERNGWHQVNRNAVTMIRYAGSDVLDLAAVLRVLPPLPVGADVVERERITQTVCARAAMDGFPLDEAHIGRQIAETEAGQQAAQAKVAELTGGAVTNPSSSGDVLKYLLDHGYQLKPDRKSKQPSAGKQSLEPYAARGDELAASIVAYRGSVTKLGLLLRPLKNLCTHGDGIMRPTVYTVNAKTGRMSCVRPNGQQFSRQGGVRACVRAGSFYLSLTDGQWTVTDQAGGVLTEMRGISADFEGCEIRVAAALSGDKALYRAEAGPECHRCGIMADMAKNCLCGPGKAHQGLHWLTAHTAHGENATKEHRYQAKRGTFTRLFGGGPSTAADQVGCDVELMYKIWDAFDTVAPGYTWWDQCMRQGFKDGTVTWRDYSTGTNYSQPNPAQGIRHLVYKTYSGRNIYITNGEHAAGNGAIQGTARELLVDGIIRWSSTRWGQLPLLPVHDQAIVLVPAHEAAEATAELARCMSTDILSSPGFPVHIGVDTDEPFVNWPDSS